ncbi:unnamed protein product [Danaus chrysippus]|uniref:(African queen) hypothetical protein n=1 Tax=Danaus chrysippus TaxID=151541 RepID=A0A8J2WCB0_9NEOP|nr:unnamed protein product [Danaus chrysippus]
MTLHWWMHWFWVTTLLLIIACTVMNDAAPQTELHQERQPRAMYFTKNAELATRTTNETNTKADVNGTTANTTEIKWTPVNTDNITIIPLSENTTNITDYGNTTEIQNTTFTTKRTNFTITDFVKEDFTLEGSAESRIVTEKPLSLETIFLQTRIPPNVESSRRIIDSSGGGMDTGAIAGISFAALVLAALAGSTAFVLYRRRYLNKPQTLNDKCSNPDSSGYLDDSTIRDNSEEMYSLDNDSFLNSLEAMTIQNYWTDTVKHTKL